MLERAPGIYEAVLHSKLNGIGEINIFLIPGRKGERSLMVDAGFRETRCLETMEEAMKSLGIPYDKLDIFLTHKHYDHCGLAGAYAKRGARLFMNPQEDRHFYDCLYYSHGFQEDQPEVLRAVGITKERAPQVWNMFMEVNRRVKENRGWDFKIPRFSYTPVEAGRVFSYGGYDFEAVHLKGHTFGQLGLYEKKCRILFCADQVIDGIVPIVGTTYPNEHLLMYYFESLEHFKHEYADCLMLPAHRQPVRDVNKVVNRIVFSYLDKTDLLKHILEYSRHRMTVREMACLAYGMEAIPGDDSEFIKLKLVMSKTFSCLEYLQDKDFAIRSREDGILYWESPGGSL